MANFLNLYPEAISQDWWIADDKGQAMPITNNVAYLQGGTQYTLHHPGSLAGGGGAGGLSNANSNVAQKSLLKNHPKQPSVIPTKGLFEPVGSSVTMAPHDMGEDIDWLVWFDEKMDLGNFMLQLGQAGFKLDNSGQYDPDMFVSYKKGTENYILTDKAEFFDKFIKARNLCQFLNLYNKEDRIAVHAAIMKGEFPSYNTTPFASCGYTFEEEQPEW